MNSSLISKIEKAKRYAAEPDRVQFQALDVTFRGDNGTHKIEPVRHRALHARATSRHGLGTTFAHN